MYITMMPLILGGISNMILCKTKIYKRYNTPIDSNTNWIDGNRVFGDNKTVIGFISMIVFTVIFQVLWGTVSGELKVDTLNEWYNIHSNNVLYNIWIGALTGTVYMLCELPNSFIKRRLGIPSGKTINSKVGKLFFIVDQIDSLIGVFIILMIYGGITIHKYIAYIIIGGLTHITINIVLYLIKVRKNI